MAREGYLILDSDLHMMEPDDLWARYLDGPHKANPPRFLGGQQQALTASTEDKAHADTIMGMEVQGLAIPAFGTQVGATVSSRELRRRSRARHPHFNVARARGFDAPSTLTAMDIEVIDVAVMYGTRGRQILCHDDLSPDYAAALARAYNNWAADYCKADPVRLKFAAQIAKPRERLKPKQSKLSLFCYFVCFEHLKLFRISDFVLRSFRPGLPCVFARVYSS